MSGKRRLLFVGYEGFEHWTGHPLAEPVGRVDLYGEHASEGERDRAGAHWPESLRICQAYPDLDTAIALARPDAAVVSVPGGAKTTVDAEALLLARGVDVLAKKLRLGDYRDIERLRAASEAGPGRLFVGEHYRQLPQVEALRQLLAAGKLGRIWSVTWRCRLPYEAYDWMRGYRHLALEDLAYHHFGVLHDVLGFHAERLYAQSFEPPGSTAGTMTAASALADTAEGYRLNYQLLWCSSQKPFGYFGEAVFEGRQVTARLTDEGLEIYSDAGRKKRIDVGEVRYQGAWGPLIQWLDEGAGAFAGMTPLGGASLFGAFEPVLGAISLAVRSAETGQACVRAWPEVSAGGTDRREGEQA
ncbi:Gfo/Idh/MocA family protein [Cohnella sp. 56]|uniref:Gfo/Idh/MocA family protein n=1 Tax=Cohnella sp. 56 TaxID=3113722 RepID=UPI0030EA7FF2